MKTYPRPATLVTILAISLLIHSCSKNNTPPGGGGGNTNPFNIMYPATESFYEGNYSGYPTVWTYRYDNNNNLTWYGQDSGYYREINQHGVNQYSYDLPLYIFGNSYSYSIANTLDSSVNIYTGLPTQVRSLRIDRDVPGEVTTTTPSGLSYWINTADGLLDREVTSDGGGLNVIYSYDDQKNLKGISWVALTGPRVGAEYARLKVVSLDDHPSPFWAVRGWRIISYPQAYPDQFGLAYCHNNPIQIIVEDYDANTGTYKPYEQDDFVYTYNEAGYPSHIVLTRTYYTTIVSHFTVTYDYTYRE